MKFTRESMVTVLFQAFFGCVCLQLACTNAARAQNTIEETSGNALSTIIPKPLRVKEVGGSFEINAATRIFVDPGNPDLKAIGEKLSDQIKNVSGMDIMVSDGNPTNNSILLRPKTQLIL